MGLREELKKILGTNPKVLVGLQAESAAEAGRERRAARLEEKRQADALVEASLPGLVAAEEKALAEVERRNQALKEAQERYRGAAGARMLAGAERDVVHARADRALRDPSDPVNVALGALWERLYNLYEVDRGTPMQSESRGEPTWGGRRLGPHFSNRPPILTRLSMISKAMQGIDEMRTSVLSVEDVQAFEAKLLAGLPKTDELVEVT